MTTYRTLMLTDLWEQTDTACRPDETFWSPKAKKLCDWWWHERQEGMPRKANFDILEHIDAAPDIFLVEVQSDGSYVTKLIGENARISVEEGRLRTAIRSDDDRRFIRTLHTHYTLVVQQEVPFKCVGTAVYNNQQEVVFEGIDCPLSLNGKTVSHIVGILIVQQDQKFTTAQP